MGRQAKKRVARKLFGGKSAEQVHRETILRPCTMCGKLSGVTLKVFAPAIELMQKHPAFMMSLARENNGQIPLVDLRGPGDRPVKYARVAFAAACDDHVSELEREAGALERHYARIGVGNLVVEFNRGPGPEKPIVQVA